ncbi:MAG: hypothetical protein KJ583_02185 [Nanoarchaeota archaeon]|nr:hypothetical protein [Nanoarchaeota archaeon]MBU1269681.1 hypothetical protein [Nanoarchaeota archaeon]MBU1604103.1 hypothetical protein [Nanoarchaeota archaeon]MBU2443605.1 hypothetical protein [Nanoarchaeota archaeon]
MGDYFMQTRIIAATGEQELEQKVNTFIIGKNIVDIKLTEWVNYPSQTGGYTAYILYEHGVPARQIQIKIIAVTGDVDLEREVNMFISNKLIVDVKYTEWVDYEAQTGGYTALIMYIAEQGSYTQASQQSKSRFRADSKSAPQFDVL